MSTEQTSIPKVLFLTGSDSIGREKAKEKYRDSLFGLYPDISEEKYDSSVESFESFIERIITPSLFQNTRLFIIRHAQNVPTKEIEKLSPILDSEIPDAFVFIEWDTPNKRGRQTKTIAQLLGVKKRAKEKPELFRFLEFDRPPDYKMAEWLTNQVPLLFDRTIAKQAAQDLVDLVGNELDKLYSELQKIDIHLPEKAPINQEVITTITGASRTVNPFELAKALAQKNVSRVLELIDALYNQNVSTTACLNTLFKYYWNLFKIRAYAHGNRKNIEAYRRARYSEQMKIAHTIGVETTIMAPSDSEKKAYPIMILSGIIDQALKYRYTHFKTIFTHIKDFDRGVKTGGVKPTKEAFEQLCYRIVRVAQLEEKGAA